MGLPLAENQTRVLEWRCGCGHGHGLPHGHVFGDLVPDGVHIHPARVFGGGSNGRGGGGGVIYTYAYHGMHMHVNAAHEREEGRFTGAV